MGLILPGDGASAAGSIIAPRSPKELKGPTRKYFLADNDLLHRVRESNARGHLRVHAVVPHIVGCSDSGLFGCLHCEKFVYLGETPEDRSKMMDFIRDHRSCPAPNRTASESLGEFVVEA